MGTGNYVAPRFLTPLRMEPARNPANFADWDGKRFRLTEVLKFADSSGTVHEVPEGFIFNGATTRPASGWEWVKTLCQFVAELVVKPMGTHAEATALHDYIYATPSICINRLDADKLFRQALLISGVHSKKAFIMYKAVRIGAKPLWQARSYVF